MKKLFTISLSVILTIGMFGCATAAKEIVAPTDIRITNSATKSITVSTTATTTSPTIAPTTKTTTVPTTKATAASTTKTTTAPTTESTTAPTTKSTTAPTTAPTSAPTEACSETPTLENYHGHVYTGGESSKKYHYEEKCAGKYSHEITWEEVDERNLGPCGTCVLK